MVKTTEARPEAHLDRACQGASFSSIEIDEVVVMGKLTAAGKESLQAGHPGDNSLYPEDAMLKMTALPSDGSQASQQALETALSLLLCKNDKSGLELLEVAQKTAQHFTVCSSLYFASYSIEMLMTHLLQKSNLNEVVGRMAAVAFGYIGHAQQLLGYTPAGTRCFRFLSIPSGLTALTAMPLLKGCRIRVDGDEILIECPSPVILEKVSERLMVVRAVVAGSDQESQRVVLLLRDREISCL